MLRRKQISISSNLRRPEKLTKDDEQIEPKVSLRLIQSF